MSKKARAVGGALVALGIVFLAGCGGVEIRQITRDHPYEKGLRFYRPHPYLWVTKDKAGALQASIAWLPDKSQEYVANVHSGLGKVDSKFNLENGWNLTGFNETRESPTADMITALTGSLKDVKALLKAPRLGKEEELTPGLYVFTFDSATGLVNGLKPVVQFE